MTRCRGACCSKMPLSLTPAQLTEQADIARAALAAGTSTNESFHRDQIEIAAMAIPVAVNPQHPDRMLYDCRNQLPSGDCAIYESRPYMCRNHPTNPEGCEREDCASDLHRIKSKGEKMNHSETIEVTEEEVRPGLVAPAPPAPAEEPLSERAQAAESRIAELVALAGLGNCHPPTRLVMDESGEALEWDKPAGRARLFFGADGSTVRASVTCDGAEKSAETVMDGVREGVSAVYVYAMARSWVGG